LRKSKQYSENFNKLFYHHVLSQDVPGFLTSRLMMNFNHVNRLIWFSKAILLKLSEVTTTFVRKVVKPLYSVHNRNTWGGVEGTSILTQKL